MADNLKPYRFRVFWHGRWHWVTVWATDAQAAQVSAQANYGS